MPTFVTLSEQGAMVEDSQGSFAPEILAGPVFERRFTGRLRNGNYVSVTASYAVVRLSEVFNREADDWDFDVMGMTEFRVTADADGEQEINTEYSNDDEWPSYTSFATEQEATDYAKRICRSLSVEMFSVQDE